MGGGPLGALAGFALGALFDAGVDSVNTTGTPYPSDSHTQGAHGKQYRRRTDEGERNSFLFSLLVLASYIIRADGQIAPSEIEALREITQQLGLATSDLNTLLHLGQQDLESAYRVLGIPATATDAEVKEAYRKMALRHHPDRVAALGEDVRKAAERKFQEVNEAKERIYQARGL